MQQVQQSELTWAARICIWFNQYDFFSCGVRPGAAAGSQMQWDYDKDGTKTSNLTGNYTAGSWRWFKIVVTGSTVYAYYSDDGQTWTLMGSTSRASTWIIDASSLVILGHGSETNSSDCPNPDWDNNWSSTGSNLNSYFDDFIMFRGESITMSGLPDGWYFKVRKGGNYYQSGSASGGTASLNCTSFETQAPFDEIELYNSNNQLILDNRFPGDVWPGDAYTYSSG
jgi:hypothetical protein